MEDGQDCVARLRLVVVFSFYFFFNFSQKTFSGRDQIGDCAHAL